MQELKEKLEVMIEEPENSKIIIGGDFNARIGYYGKTCDEEEEKGTRRNTKDSVCNKDGKILLEMVEERGWDILNGNTEGDEEGEYTFVGVVGSTVIDYVLINTEARNEIKRLKIEDRVELDHLPLTVEMYRRRLIKKKKKEEKWRQKRIWTEEGVTRFKEELENVSFDKIEINEMIEELIEKVDNAVVKEKKIIKSWKLGQSKWWDKECSTRKKE